MISMAGALALYGFMTSDRAAWAGEHGSPSADEIIEKLKAPAAGLGMFRGVIIVPPAEGVTDIKNPDVKPASTDPNAKPTPPPPPPPPTINMKVVFEVNSSRLSNAALNTLSELGKALNDELLLPYTFLIAGHTDAMGSESYNQRLSERRAESVRDYLNYRYGIDRNRLKVLGFGEDRLIDRQNPHSKANRRVQISNLGKVEE